MYRNLQTIRLAGVEPGDRPNLTILKHRAALQSEAIGFYMSYHLNGNNSIRSSRNARPWTENRESVDTHFE